MIITTLLIVKAISLIVTCGCMAAIIYSVPAGSVAVYAPHDND